MKALVIGGTGFIGSNLISRLIKDGYKTFYISKTKTLPKSKASQTKLNIENKDDVKNYFLDNQFDLVFNCGGYIERKEDFSVENQLFKTHLFGTKNIVESLNWDQIKCFIQVGSAKEYGIVDSPIKENSYTNPTTPYGFAKLISSKYILMRSKLMDLPVIVVRPFLTYGIRSKEGLIPYICSESMKKKELYLSDPDVKLDLIYISDLVNALLILAKKPSLRGEIFNIGSGKSISIRNIASLILKKTNVVKINWTKNDRKGEARDYFADISKIKTLSDWKPQISFEEGLNEYIKTQVE